MFTAQYHSITLNLLGKPLPGISLYVAEQSKG